MSIATIDDVRRAEGVIRQHISPVPLVRSYSLESQLGLPPDRRVWLKDYGWTPVGSFKLMGALNWMHNNAERIGDRPVAAHSSGNFASGISFAGMRYNKKVIVVMPDDAPKIKFARTKGFGAEVRTYNKSRDHETGEREKMTQEIADELGATQASPYDDNDVIAGNGVGGLEVVQELNRQDRRLSHFFAPVSGGGLMAGLALAIADGFPEAKIIGVEPSGADDFCQSMQAQERVRIDRPESICDGLLSYSVGAHNWPILQQHVSQAVSVPDDTTRLAMQWLYNRHGLRCEPSGAIALAALLSRQAPLEGDGDVVVVLSGRNVDEDQFRSWIENR